MNEFVQSSRGMRVCRRITRHYAKTFYFASHCLPRPARIHAYAVYGFCRWADNGVDDAVTPEDAIARVEFARNVLDDVYSSRPVPPGLQSFRHTVYSRGTPRYVFDALLDGMAMDLSITRYPDFPALDLYCYRVAGVVGLMMTYIFGYRDERCFPQALALGTAMQLTNILRDIAEDLGKGRIYLPLDEMARFGVTEDQLHQGLADDRFKDLMKFQIARARMYYAEAERGIPDLLGWSSRLTVRVMGTLYGQILNAIESLDYQVFQHRAHVPTGRKLRLLASCIAQTE